MAGWIEAVFLIALGAPSPPERNSCVACHEREAEPRLTRPVASVAASVHAELEPCVSCHGGDEKDPTLRAHDRAHGFRVPRAAEIPFLCGDCHANAAFMRRFSAQVPVDQLSLYRVSEHGKALQRGESKAATCTSCHGDAHSMREVRHPDSPVSAKNVSLTCGRCHSDAEHPARRRSETDPVLAWNESVHRRAMFEKNDTSAPTCNDCHGDHGAAPPGLPDIHRACGACHAEQSERFTKSVHRAPFERLGFGECQECHGRHSIGRAGDEMLSESESGVCRRCHAAGDEAGRTAREIRDRIEEAARIQNEVREAMESARRRGLLVPEAEVAEKEIYTLLQRLRIAVHDMNAAALDPDLGEIRERRDRVARSTEARIEELRFRRNGYVFFIAVIAMMVLLLSLKVRRLPG